MKISVGDLFDGRFRIEGEQGGVHTALDQHTGQRVCLSVFDERSASDPTTAGRFAERARAARDVHHPGLIPVMDAGVHFSTPWIATALREGETLRARIDRGPVPADQALDLGVSILEALGAAHAVGLVHGALSPEDVIVGPDGAVGVRGFGKGALPAREASSSHIAPEQASGDKIVGPAADVYSVCAILYEAISGSLPYDASSFGELVKAMYTSGPTPIQKRKHDVPARLASTIDRGLAVEPMQRPADARELIDALVEIRATLGQGGELPKTMALDAGALQAAVANTAPGFSAGAFNPMAHANTEPAFSAAAGAPNLAQAAVAVRPPPAAQSSGGSGAVIGLAVGGCALLMGLLFLGGVGAAAFMLSARGRSIEETPPQPYHPDVSVSSLAPLAGIDAERSRVDARNAPAIGGAEPLVTIVTFSEFQCPFCSRVDPTMDRIRETYGDRVRYVFRHNPLPFHADAMPAAQAAHEAYVQGGETRFWAMHDILFANQRDLGRASLEGHAASAGMDVTALRAALDSARHLPRIEADQALAARVGARGTPAFFINGRNLMGAQPYESFTAVIDEEIAIAEALMARGVPRSALYESFMRDAIDGAAPDPDPSPTPSQPDPNAIYRVPIDGSPIRGANTALVTIVTFSEFQCPFCNRVQPTLQRIAEHYGAEVRFVWKHNPLPFHVNAMPAAELAAEAHAQGRFWELHDTLFENQAALGREDLERYAGQHGLQAASVRRALDQHAHRETIERDQNLARSLGALGTPSFFINGRNLRGAQPFEAFQRVIDEEMTRARGLLAAGTPRTAIYEALTRDGHTTPQLVAPPDPTLAPTPTPPPSQRYVVPVPARVPTRGPLNAPLTIQIFSDFQCPFCSRATPTVDQIVETYGSRVRVVWRNYPLPFHERAMPAAQAAMEVYEQGGDAAFWRYHNLVFENQRELGDENLVSLARGIPGVDANRVAAAIRDGRHRARVQSDIDAVQTAGMQIGTPSFLIGDRLLQGAQPFEAFRAEIDAALAR